MSDILPPLSHCLEVGASCSRPDTASFHRLSPGVPRFFLSSRDSFFIILGTVKDTDPFLSQIQCCVHIPVSTVPAGAHILPI